MHDPCTVAFEIKSPFRKAPSKLWPKGYRNTLVTIWHVDPENFAGKCGVRRNDDSCGWFTPTYSVAAKERMQKLGREQYRQIFSRQVAEREGKSYAYLCFVPSAYDAIYWTWRAIHHSERPQVRWQYGVPLSASALQEIYELSSCPVDNLRHVVAEVHDEESFLSFFLLVYGLYLRHHRPWYKHPRWHIQHWSLQVHPLQKLLRFLFRRCASCNRRLGWNEVAIGEWSGDRIWHDRCSHEGEVHETPA